MVRYYWAYRLPMQPHVAILWPLGWFCPPVPAAYASSVPSSDSLTLSALGSMLPGVALC